MQEFGLNDLAWIGGSLLCVSIIGMLWRFRAAILSIVSGLSARARTEGVARRAYRERVYASAHYVESDPEPVVRTTPEPLELVMVLTDTHQAEPVEPAPIEPPREPVSLRKIPKTDLIVLLAVQRKENGDYLYSANEITDFIGGTAAPIKKLIAEVRDEAPPEQAARLGHLPRPIGGWN